MQYKNCKNILNDQIKDSLFTFLRIITIFLILHEVDSPCSDTLSLKLWKSLSLILFNRNIGVLSNKLEITSHLCFTISHLKIRVKSSVAHVCASYCLSFLSHLTKIKYSINFTELMLSDSTKRTRKHTIFTRPWSWRPRHRFISMNVL